MPFQSEKQRRFLWAKHPEIARRWTNEHGSTPVKTSEADLPVTSDESANSELMKAAQLAGFADELQKIAHAL